MTNRQLAALETKKKLLDAAKKIICEKGLTNTSVAEIAKTCGVANGTFYTYFKKKEDILFELSEEIFSDITKDAQAYKGDFMQRLVYFITNFSKYIEAGSLKMCQEWVRNTVDPELVENHNNKTKLDCDILAIKQLINDGIERGDLKADTPVELLAHTVADILYGQMLCWDMSGGKYSFESRTKEFCDNFLKSIISPYLL